MRKGSRLPPEALARFVLPLPPPMPGRELPPPPAPIDWSALFGNDHPVEVEVGSGSGLFLVNAALAYPETNYLGIEVIRKYYLYIANRLARRGIPNVRVACADARWVLRDWIATASVQTVHVYFPDPWWKSRHQKRRVFTDEFAVQTLRILRPGGSLLVVTDVADYATMVRETMADLPCIDGEPPTETAGASDMDYLTNFERKFRRQGLPIHRMRFVKPADISPDRIP